MLCTATVRCIRFAFHEIALSSHISINSEPMPFLFAVGATAIAKMPNDSVLPAEPRVREVDCRRNSPLIANTMRSRNHGWNINQGLLITFVSKYHLCVLRKPDRAPLNLPPKLKPHKLSFCHAPSATHR